MLVLDTKSEVSSHFGKPRGIRWGVLVGPVHVMQIPGSVKQVATQQQQ